MNGNHSQNNNNNNPMCNSNQISKNLPLKKRRTYLVDPSMQNESQDENLPQTTNRVYTKEDPLQLRLSPGTIAPTPPPSSPQIELLRQQYAYLLANSTNTETASYLPPSTYDCLMAQKVLAQQFLDNYRALLEQQQAGYPVVEDHRKPTDLTIDEHFRKSLGDDYDKFPGGFLTPEDSSLNSSPTGRTPVDSIEEHFARSLAKFWPLTGTSSHEETSDHQTTESVVDDHFAKALGAKTWEKLKEKS